MTITRQPLTNGASWPRELKPTVLVCVHVTANMGSARDQVHYANRPGSGGPSAHDYLDPDGSGLEALDPAKRCAWSNGDVQGPNLKIPTVKAAVLAKVNPNRIVYREVECVGDGSHPVTDAQLEQVARLVAADAKATGLPVNRSTVTTHADWNSVTRNNCAFRPSVREARLAAVIARANAILHPAPDKETDMATTTADWAAAVAKIRGYVGTYLAVPRLNSRQRAALLADLRTLDRDLAGLEESLRAAAPAPKATTAKAPAAAPKAPAAALTYDQETPILLDAEDELLKAAGKPYGRDGAERGSLPLGVHIDLCKRLGLPLHLAEFESFVVPGASQ